MTMRSFFIIQLSCIGFILRKPLVLILWLLSFATVWLPLILIVFNYEYMITSIAVPIAMCLFFIAIFPIMRRFSVRHYLLQLGANVNTANYKWYHIQSLYAHIFLQPALAGMYSIFFRPNYLLSIPASIKEGLPSRKDIINRIESLTNSLSDAQRKEWSIFFQRAGIFNICTTILLLIVTATIFNSPWWIFIWICTSAYIMSLYGLYSVLFYLSVARIQIPIAPEILQKFVSNMKYN